ncbi:hypothetical protein EXIGLDRAFT_722484 [Exidia glandulosa HHB12029]|uniref:Uncharacterized protein n=1 Tax=Exidia glandulosa HHB12029 TaxID=1314781 RepID=A0A165FA93_EXIGL|nr:hypothetical protein EXIGLDRAFT_722484 [Exidia glandulosa HHB12029]
MIPSTRHFGDCALELWLRFLGLVVHPVLSVRAVASGHVEQHMSSSYYSLLYSMCLLSTIMIPSTRHFSSGLRVEFC